MPDETTQQSGTEEGNTEEVVASPGRTPEEIEEFWRNRISGSDRAHAAEARVLREEIARLKGEGQAPNGGQSTAGDDSAKEVERLKAELEAERATRIVETRTAKYPDAAAALGDPRVVSSMDEARLAALQETLRVEPSKRPVGSSNPSRTQSTEKPLHELSKAEIIERMAQLPAPGRHAEV